jgi:hypothetical protein
MTTDIDDLTMKRATANHAKALAGCVYEIAAHLQNLLQAGLSVDDILRAVWAKLEPREAGRIGEEVLVDSFAPILSFLIPMMQDGPEAQRMDRAISAMRTSFGGTELGCDLQFSRAVAGLESAAHRIGATPPSRMKATILRLFAENPSPLPDQAPALECWVTITGIPMSLQGSLSETPEGGLRLMSPLPASQQTSRSQVQMVEQFFCYEDVVSVAVRREVNVNAPRIRS